MILKAVPDAEPGVWVAGSLVHAALDDMNRLERGTLSPVWWPEKSATGFQQEEPKPPFPCDFLDLSLPFESQECGEGSQVATAPFHGTEW